MKLKILISLGIMIFFTHILTAQKSIKINQTIKGDTLLYAFNNEIIGSLKLNAKVQLDNENSLVRVILVDSNLSEWLVYETYYQINENNPLSVVNESDETEFLDHVHPKYLKIQITDASLSINSLELGETLNKGKQAIEIDQKAKKQRMNDQKIEQLNRTLKTNGKSWIAGKTGVSDLTYEKKKELFGRDKFNSKGLEFYIGGVFEFNNQEDLPKLKSTLTSCFIDHFDWREKHGANQSNSPYYDGDVNGSGWLTSVKNQPCSNCWAYAAVGETEVVANLYYNRHVDFDLSEAEITSCYGPGNTCSSGWVNNGLNYIKNNGVVNESCFPTPPDDFQHACIEKCTSPSEQLRISDYTRTNITVEDSLKRMVIKTPLTVVIDVPYFYHAMVLCGYHKIAIGDRLYYCSETGGGWITINARNTLIGKTYWILKNSWDTTIGDKGYIYMIINDLSSVLSGDNQICTIIPPISSLNYSNDYVRCVDLDGDGYFNWGIGTRPSTCSSEEDGDDSNSNLGPINKYGYCAHLVRTNQTWQTTSDEYANVIIKNGGNLTLNGATVNLNNNSSFSVELGGTLTINSGTIQ